MAPAEIPRPQSQRVALYEQRFGKFDSGKNAYWSLRKERPVTLAEGAAFDRGMRAGRLKPTGYAKARTLVPQRGTTAWQAEAARRRALEVRSGGGAPPMRRRLGYPIRLTGPIAPSERTAVMPTEAKRIAMLPAAPPPGPARAPWEPLFQAITRQFREKKAGPATQQITVRPSFAAPSRPLAAAAPAPMAMAGFDMKKLALPLALIAGAFVVSKLV